MKLLNSAWKTVDDVVANALIAMILFGLLVVAIAFIFGAIGFYLLAIAFPMYVSFSWDILRILAIGFLAMLF
jgi:hypothetical protein